MGQDRVSDQGEPDRPVPAYSPFQRLARVHAAATATDAVMAVALAGSIFFSISPDAARNRIALYLALTMAPFAVVTPLIGPVIDRMPGGRRAMILVTNLGRLVVALLLIRHLDTLWLFPEAFALLVLQKSYAVAKSAVVPRYVPKESNLVQANSRLALISAVMSLVGAGIGAALAFLGSPALAAAAATIGYLVATAITFQLPRIPVARTRPTSTERTALRASAILLSASAMAVMRGAVGFVTFLLAFALRGGEEGLDVSAPGAAAGGAVASERGVDIVGDPGAPFWHYAVVVAVAGLAAFTGVQIAPILRRRLVEEMILLGSLAVALSTALLAAMTGGLMGMALLSGGVAISAAVGKLAFDSLVQRDAPDANHGRSFSRFEARFQIAWVVGAFAPVVLPIPARLGSGLVALGAAAALIFFILRRRRPATPGPRELG
ncbi:MAG: MFS transporter [Acidimicrobiaceae bacterium]|nr:MFS transporter [Acidimicrobiaceae bacterium]